MSDKPLLIEFDLGWISSTLKKMILLHFLNRGDNISLFGLKKKIEVVTLHQNRYIDIWSLFGSLLFFLFKGESIIFPLLSI